MNIVRMYISLSMCFLINMRHILFDPFPFNSSKICYESYLNFILRLVPMILELLSDELKSQHNVTKKFYTFDLSKLPHLSW